MQPEHMMLGGVCLPLIKKGWDKQQFSDLIDLKALLKHYAYLKPA